MPCINLVNVLIGHFTVRTRAEAVVSICLASAPDLAHEDRQVRLELLDPQPRAFPGSVPAAQADRALS